LEIDAGRRHESMYTSFQMQRFEEDCEKKEVRKHVSARRYLYLYRLPKFRETFINILVVLEQP
jgi:hypothetical protein